MENRTRKNFLAVCEACMAIYSDLLQAVKREYLSAVGYEQRGAGASFSASAVPQRRVCTTEMRRSPAWSLVVYKSATRRRY